MQEFLIILGLFEMKDKIEHIKNLAFDQINKANDSKTIENIKIHFLGKKGELTSLLKMLGSLKEEDRPKFGAEVNTVRNQIEESINIALEKILNKELNQKFENEKIDITLKGRKINTGAKHPLKIVLNELEEIFMGMGFNIEEGPEIENDYYNFESLNIPETHPSRDAQDTLYFKNGLLLRTHTSPVQMRTMEKYNPNPIRAIFPGRVFRRDTCDASHSPQFYQIEGLLIDKNVKFSDLKGILEIFAKKMFGEEREIKLRPGFFPFTEPSAEVDVSCIMCGGKGCSMCKGSGWLEILGSGCVHPNVLKNGGYDPEIYSGFAFGMGIDRIALLKYKIPDIRLLYENDVRFLHQFR